MRMYVGPLAALAVLATLGLGGCGSKEDDVGNTVGNLFAFNSTTAPPLTAANRSNDVVCPPVLVAEGQASYRIYAGADKSNAGVKQQFALGALSRDCDTNGGSINLRLGISGYVQAGPAGGSGAFTVPVKVVVRRESDQAPVEVRTYKISAAIAPSEASAPFSLVTDPIALPSLSKDADTDYSVYVGFDAGAPDAPKAPAKRRKRG